MKETPEKVKIQWHSYFAQVIEKICTKRNFLVEMEKEVAKMPLKIDIIVIKKQDILYKDLSSPYSYFNDINVIEFKSKTDDFDWDSLYQVEVYGKLYSINKKIEERKRVSLWAVASHFTHISFLFFNNLYILYLYSLFLILSMNLQGLPSPNPFIPTLKAVGLSPFVKKYWVELCEG